MATSLAALGRRSEALALADEARRMLEPLAAVDGAGGAVARDAQLALAETHALLARLRPAQAAAHRQAAREALEAAAKVKRLGDDHGKLLAAMQAR
jgi:hypothetical protein